MHCAWGCTVTATMRYLSLSIILTSVNFHTLLVGKKGNRNQAVFTSVIFFSKSSLWKTSNCWKVDTVITNTCTLTINLYAHTNTHISEPFVDMTLFLSFSLSFFFFYSQIFGIWDLGLGIKLGVQLQAFVIAMARADLSHIADLHHSLWQYWILNPLSKARDRTCILRDIMMGS